MTRDEFNVMVEYYFQGDMNADEVKAFEAVLKQDADLLREFTRHSFDNMNLKGFFAYEKSQSEECVADDGAATPNTAAVVRRRRRRQSSAGKRFSVAPYLVAACLLLFFSLTMYFSGSQEPPSNHGNSLVVQAPVAMEALATLSGHVQGLSVLRDGKVIAAKKGSKLYDGDELATGPERKSKITFLDQSRITLGRNSKIVLSEKHKAKQIDLKSGIVYIRAKPQKKPFKIVTEQVTIAIIGTALRIESGPKQTTVKVDEGSVAIYDRGKSVQRRALLTAGMQALCRKGKVLVSPLKTQTMMFKNSVHPDVSYNGLVDSAVTKAQANRNFSDEKYVHMDGADIEKGVSVGLMRWDVKKLPKNCRIAKMTIYLSFRSAGGPVAIHVLKKQWTSNDLTWSSAKKDQSWQLPGVAGTEDYFQVPIATVSVASKAISYPIRISQHGVDIINERLDEGRQNIGFVFHSQSDSGLSFYSSSHRKLAKRPRLEISYFKLNAP